MEIHVWSDIACPWCYIGKRSLETALARIEDPGDITVIWRSFELDPHAPAKSELSMDALLAKKYHMTMDQVAATQTRITEVAKGFGLDYHLGDLQSGNTFDAHRLVHFAATHGLGDAMKERLFLAYFTEGQLMSDHEVLVSCATDLGLEERDVRAMLKSDAYASDVRFDEEQARANDFSAVPTFVVDGRFAVSGAQDPEVLVTMIERARATR
jgi:predicted DsbA family dithiol-disulfide isomerase